MSDTLKIYGVTYSGVTSLNANDTNHANKQYIRPQGTKSITSNGTGIDVTDYASVDVAVPGSNDFVIVISKNVSTEEWEPDCTFSDVADAYASSKRLVLTTLTRDGVGGVYVVDSPSNSWLQYFVEEIVIQNQRNYVKRTEWIFHSTGLYPNGTEMFVYPSGTKTITQNGTGIDVSYYANVDVSVSGGQPTIDSLTVTPSESQQTFNSSSVDGYKPVTVNAVSSTYVGSGITRRSSSDLTASGATVTVPSGYYSEQASKAVASGTAGTPTATKGTVSNHSVTVTPSVTNTTGYITGGTKTGTAVTVSASELVSGSQTITENGTVNVTNLASVTVACEYVTYYTGSSAPSSSLGVDGDIYLKTS